MTRSSEHPACTFGCPVEAVLDVIGGKWKAVILYHLMGGTLRFNELRRLLPGVTQRMLTRQLRELERDGVLVRTVYAEIPPRVEYALSEMGRSLQPVLSSLQQWGAENLEQIASIRSRQAETAGEEA